MSNFKFLLQIGHPTYSIFRIAEFKNISHKFVKNSRNNFWKKLLEADEFYFHLGILSNEINTYRKIRVGGMT